MQPETIAIITPLFNEEKNIPKFIKNLDQQTNKNFNVYFIDDGSTDSTLEILYKHLRTVDINYTILTQKNSGAAEARYNGINNAKENYCLIVDCDDAISKNMIENILKVIYTSESKIDTIIFDVLMQEENNKYKPLCYFDNKRNLFTGLECLENSIGGWKVSGLMCSKKDIFLKSYELYYNLNTNKENFINNDEIITRLNFLHSKEVQKIKSIYYYNYNNNSTTRKINTNRCLLINNAVILHKLLANHSIKEKTNKELFITLYSTAKYLKKNKKHITDKNKWISTLNDGCRYIFETKILSQQWLLNQIRFIKVLFLIQMFKKGLM